jgi:hypothetical protein
MRAAGSNGLHSLRALPATPSFLGQSGSNSAVTLGSTTQERNRCKKDAHEVVESTVECIYGV